MSAHVPAARISRDVPLQVPAEDHLEGGDSRGERQGRRAEAESAFQRLDDSYERLYYTGIARERFAKAQLAAGRPPHTLIVLFEDALTWFERAEQIRPAGNDEAILRWNRCARILNGLSTSDREHERAHLEPTDSAPV